MSDHEAVYVLYRIVKTNPPTRMSFLSHAARGRPIPEGSLHEMESLWHGLSMYDAQGAARFTAQKRPYLGKFIAMLNIPAAGFRIEKTTQHPRHYTVWGDPDALLRCVIAVTPVENAMR